MDVITTAIGLGGGDKLRIVRVIRLLRLLKLARLLRASRAKLDRPLRVRPDFHLTIFVSNSNSNFTNFHKFPQMPYNFINSNWFYKTS